MRTVSGGLATRLANETTTLCRLLTIILANGTTTYRFVDLDYPITVAGNLYSADYAFDVSAIEVKLGTGTASSYKVDLALSAASISRDIVESGALDGADIEVRIVDYQSLSDGTVLLLKGTLDECEYKDKLVASIDVATLLSQSLQIFVEAFSSNCRADLGDARCKVPLVSASTDTHGNPMHASFTVTSSPTDFQVLGTDLADADGTWDNGLVLFLTGANEGFALEIGTYAGGDITLSLITPFPSVIGDTGTVYAGCNKILGDGSDPTTGGCTKYQNWLNFRGEPFFADPAVTQATPGSIPGVTVAAPPAPPPPPPINGAIPIA